MGRVLFRAVEHSTTPKEEDTTKTLYAISLQLKVMDNIRVKQLKWACYLNRKGASFQARKVLFTDSIGKIKHENQCKLWRDWHSGTRHQETTSMRASWANESFVACVSKFELPIKFNILLKLHSRLSRKRL